MITPLQLRLVHIAAKQAGLDEEQYRMVLRNAGGVSSSKQLTQAGYEDVMAVFEDSGFRQAGQPENYWRMKVATRGGLCSARMVHRIRELADQQHYDLEGLCRRFSGGKVSQLERLSPGQALNLIDMLKAVVERTAEQPATAPSSPAETRLPVATGDESANSRKSPQSESMEAGHG